MTLTAKGLAPLTRVPDIGLGFITPKMYGAIGDGSTHPLSGFYSTLAGAQADYSFVTALTQEIDWAALQKMSYEALGYPTFEHADTNAYLNKTMQIPAGKYVLGVDTWSIKNASGVRIDGAGRRATRLFSSGCAFQTDGLWYSQITGVDFEATGATTVIVDIDGNVPGHPYATRGVQGNTFKDCYFDGITAADYCFFLCRQGGAGAQGSENLWLNCHFQSNILAGLYINGANALQNTLIGGNFQGHQKYGVFLNGGSLQLFSVGFQSTYQYAQISNGGWDIDASTFTVGDRTVVIGCRTESLRFFHGNAQTGVLIGNTQRVAYVVWSALTVRALDVVTVQTAISGLTKLYRVTTAGTSSGDSVNNSDIFSSTTIGKTGKTWTVNEFTGWRVTIVDGTGAGQSRAITSNTATTLTVPIWTTTPDATSDFSIDPTGKWPNSGTMTDGSAVWTTTEFNVVESTTQELYDAANDWQVGNVQVERFLNAPAPATVEIAASYTATNDDEMILADASSGNITITLPVAGTTIPRPGAGKRYIVKKYDTSANTVTVQPDDGGFIDNAGANPVIPGSSRGYLIVELAGGAALTRKYWVIAKSF